MELGSEFHLNLEELRICEDSVFQYMDSLSYKLFDSGRSALLALLDILTPSVILLPDYLCESVIKPFQSKCSIHFYHIDAFFIPDFSKITDTLNTLTAQEQQCPVIYLMHYFGTLIPNTVLQNILQLKNNFSLTIIEDTTHSFLSTPLTVGDFGICSLRKTFPIPDGGMLYSRQTLPAIPNTLPGRVNEKGYAAILKSLFLKKLGNYNRVYRDLFTKAEHSFDQQADVYEISDYSKFLLSCFSISKIRQQRKENYDQLFSFFQKHQPNALIFEQMTETPFTFLIRAKDRDDLRTYLISHNIYCAVHWPIANTDFEQFDIANYFSNHLLSLPIDQRYKTEEMDYLINTIKKYICERGKPLWD